MTEETHTPRAEKPREFTIIRALDGSEMSVREGLYDACVGGIFELIPVREALPSDGWQPIEIAPKDGAVVWAFNGSQARMRWILIEGHLHVGLWIWDDEDLSDIDPDPYQPTHWMPLPAPPAAALELATKGGEV